MHVHILHFMACLTLLTLLSADLRGHGTPDSVLVYRPPVYFTANAGQWEAEIRYAIIGGSTSAWLCDDGVILARPRTGIDVPTESIQSRLVPDAYEIVTIAFQDVSSRMRIVAGDTVRSVSHFYLGPDSTFWHESVSNHRVVRYENVWDGVDIEYRIGHDGSLRQTMRIAPGAQIPEKGMYVHGAGAREIEELLRGAHLRQYVESSGVSLSERMHGTIGTTGQARGFRYKDTLALTAEFNTAFNFRHGHMRHHVVSGNGEVAVHGTTTDPALPVRSAVQGTLPGSQSVFVVQFDSTGRDIIFCTYLGGTQGSFLPNGLYLLPGHNRTLVNDTEGNLYGIMQATDGAPLTTTSYKGYPRYSERFQLETAGYIYCLDPGGKLSGATYLGGPGALYILDISVTNHGVYVIGENFGDTLVMTQGAVLATKPFYDSRALVLCRLSHILDSLRYMTYLLTTEWRGHKGPIGYTGSPSDMAIDADGNVFVVCCVGQGCVYNATLPGIGSGVFSGYWFVSIGADGSNVLASRLITSDDVPGELGVRQDNVRGINQIFTSDDGSITMFGASGTDGAIGSLPAGWLSHPVFEALNRDALNAIWGMKVSESGLYPSGMYYGLSAHSVGSMQHFTTVDHTCGGYFHFTRNYRHYDTLLTVDSVSTRRDGKEERFIVNLDANLDVRYATEWNARYLPAAADYIKSFTVDKHGYCYVSARLNLYDSCRYFNSWRIPTGSALNFGQGEMYLARFRIYTPCWQIGCAISTIDTIGIEPRRGYANPEEFTVNYAVTNHSAEKGARIVHARIELPEGLELVAGSPQQPMIPSVLASGMTSACSWRVRVMNPEGLIDSGTADTALIRCRVFYVDPEAGQTYPMGEELCEHDIMVVAYDEPDPELVCTVEGPPELYWRGDGFAATPEGKSGAIRYRFTLTNLERDTITITDFRYRAGPQCRIVGDSLRSGVLLAPGASYTDESDIHVDALRYGRRVVIEAAALDEYGVPLSLCFVETDVPGVMDMSCVVTDSEPIVWNTATGTATPAVLPLTLLIDNPLDTIRRDVTLRADLSRAPHIAPAAGESLQRDPFFIIAHFRRAIDWQFVLADAPDTHVRDTIVFVYEEEGTEYRCEHVVEIRVIDKSVICTLTGTDTLSVEDMLARTPGRLHFTLTNAGTVAVDVERTELTIVPATGLPFAGLISLDPLSRQGGTIDPGNDFTIDWNLRALIRRESRTAECTVTTFDANDNALVICTREIFLEGLDGLVCALTLGDSVRFNRTELRYDPEEATADFKLENLLDTEETNIDAVIDLTQAPRFVLAPSESAGKTIAVVDSHATANLTWRLIPHPAPRAEEQDIMVRYRSDRMSAWKECRATIHIEAWPEEMSVACATGGHDSLYADLHSEQFIPDPLHASYTVTNTGTVALTGCEAAILLPPEFVLAGSDSIQYFTAPEHASVPGGPVAEGILLPNTSCTRWWKITPTPALTDTDPRQIQWQWRSAEQGTEIGCERTIHIVPDNPAGIVLTPLHLYFVAERGGVPPAEQLVQLSTGGGLAMPWTAQTSAWWLNAQPASGSQSGRIAVQPISAMLDEGAHDAEIHFAATPSGRHVAVTYVIRKSMGVNGTYASESVTLDVWPLPVPSGTRLHVRIGGPPGERCHLTLHDLLGRERLVRIVESNQAVSIDIASARVNAGVYLLRAVSEDGAQAIRMISVLR